MSFINLYSITSKNLTKTIGGSVSGTQDRSETINYSADLLSYAPKGNAPVKNFCAADSAKGQVGIFGDLGLADIVADGLLAIDKTSEQNLYASGGPSPAPVTRPAGFSFNMVPPMGSNLPKLTGVVVGNMTFSASSTGDQITLTGSAILTDGVTSVGYLVNWSGSAPQQVAHGKDSTFTLSGAFQQIKDEPAAATWADKLGLSPTVSLVARMHGADPNALELFGSSTTADKEKSYKVTSEGRVTAKAAKPSAPKAASSSGGGNGTSFGSIVTFNIAYGLNGGPNWTLTNFKGPAGGSTQLFNGDHSNNDSVTITFVATCQEVATVDGRFTTASNYWESIGSCQNLQAALQGSEAAGRANNTNMILKNFAPLGRRVPGLGG